MKPFILLLILILSQIFIVGQTKKIDSLKMTLKKPLSDSLIVNSYSLLIKEFAKEMDSTKVMFFYNEGRKHIARKKYIAGIVSLNYALADYYAVTNEFKESMKLYTELVRYGKKNNKNLTLVSVYTNIGYLYYQASDFEKAEAYNMLALSFEKKTKIDPMTLGNIHLNNSAIYGTTEKFDKAIQSLESAEYYFLKLNDSSSLSYVYTNKSFIFMAQKNLAKALEFGEKSKAIKLKIGTPKDKVNCYSMMGTIYFLLKEFDKSIENNKRALTLIDTTKAKTDLPELYNSISNAYYELKKYKEAIDFKKMAEQAEKSLNLQESRSALREHDLASNFKEIKLADSLKFAIERKIQKHKSDVAKWQRFALFGGLTSALIFAFIIFRRYKSTKQKNQIIANQKLEVEDKNKQIIDSINYAQRIQKSLLTNLEFIEAYLPKFTLFFRPKDIVSGDFYWAIAAEANSISADSTSLDKTSADSKHLVSENTKITNLSYFYLAICDSTGHGVPGAFMSLLNTSFLNEAIIEKNILEPNLILDYVRTRLLRSMPDGQDGMDATLLRFNMVNGKIDYSQGVTYAAANNEPVLFRSNEISVLPKDKIPVGKSYHTGNFMNYHFDTNPKDRIFIYTDGFSDQFGGPKEKKFKSSVLNSLLLAQSPLEINQIHSVLATEFDNWKAAGEQIDDVCVFGFEVS